MASVVFQACVDMLLSWKRFWLCCSWQAHVAELRFHQHWTSLFVVAQSGLK
jgi:hypothetical protein